MVSLKSKRKFHGFTLVELVVVITILAILGTVGFLSVGGYSSRARDSARIGDIAQLSKSLDLSVITVGNYPVPDNAFSVTYSGGVVWNQGAVGTAVMNLLRGTIAGGGLNMKPVDPLKHSEYVYSSLAQGKAYQIKAEYEGDLSPNAWNAEPLMNTAYAAAGDPTIAYIRGNYGGLAAKTVSGSTICILALPSIITGTGVAGSVLEITNDTLSGTLLFTGKSLKKASGYNPNSVIFCGATLPTNDTSGQITSMMTSLKTAYSGSDLAGFHSNIATLLSTNST